MSTPKIAPLTRHTNPLIALRMNTIRAVGFLFYLAASANAATVISTFGPSDSYASSTVTSIGDVPEDGIIDLQRAYPFLVPSSASFLFDGIEVAVGAKSPQGTTLFFDLLSDAGGLPGTVLESFTFTGITASISGEIVSGQSVLRPMLLAGQTYWLAASAPQSTMYWNLSSIDPPSANARRSGPGSWELVDGDDPRSAFRVSGTAVPEPTACSLISIAVVAFMVPRGFHRSRVEGRF